MTMGHYAVLCAFLEISDVSTLMAGWSSGNMMVMKCDLSGETYCVYAFPDKSHLIIIIFPEDDPAMRVETSDITKNPHNTA